MRGLCLLSTFVASLGHQDIGLGGATDCPLHADAGCTEEENLGEYRSVSMLQLQLSIVSNTSDSVASVHVLAHHQLSMHSPSVMYGAGAMILCVVLCAVGLYIWGGLLAQGFTSKQDPWSIIPTFVVLSGAQVLDSVDYRLLSSSMRALEQDLGLSPSELSQITLAQGIAMAVGSPVWGHLSDRCNRGKVLAVGCAWWGITTAMLGKASSLRMLILARFLNGIAFASIAPIAQSWIADMTKPEIRGTCFGIVFAVGAMGGMVADIVLPGISTSIILGIEGWRVAAYAIAIASLLYIIVVLGVLRDPRVLPSKLEDEQTSFQGFLTVVRCRTWQLICAQGVFGAVPYSVFSFVTMYFQYLGFPSDQAGFIVSLQTLGYLIGTLVAGFSGDYAVRVSRDHGRIFLAQVAGILRVPLVVMIFLVFPHAGAGIAPYGCAIACLGFLMAVPSGACSRPILTEVVRPELRGSIIAYQAVLEKSVGAFGAMAAASLAQSMFHYKTTTQSVADMPDTVREGNANALGKAILFNSSVPWLICAILYGLVYFSYKHDRDSLASNKLSGMSA